MDHEAAVFQPLTGDPLAPRSLQEFVGQPLIVRQLALELSAALREGRMPRHCLLYGGPGLGKSTLGEVLWRELDQRWHPVDIYRTSGPEFDTITRTRETLWLLARGGNPVVVLMDECDALPRAPAYMWFAVLTHNAFSGGGRMVNLPPLCLVATTNHTARLPTALRSRFALRLPFTYYPPEDLAAIAKASAARLGLTMGEEAATHLGANSGGEPRRVLQIVQTAATLSKTVDLETAKEAIEVLDLFPRGLSRLQVDYLLALSNTRPKQTAGLQTLAGTLGEDAGDLRLEAEPYLLRSGLVRVAAGGRQLAERGLAYLDALRAEGLVVPV